MGEVGVVEGVSMEEAVCGDKDGSVKGESM